MADSGGRLAASAWNWIRAAVVGAIGTPLLIWFLLYIWAPLHQKSPGTTTLPVVILLAMPVGLLAGSVSRGVGGFVAFWLGAFAATFAAARAYSGPGSGFAALAVALALLVIPQAVLLGYGVARVVDGLSAGRPRTVAARFVYVWLVPSALSFAAVALIAPSNAGGLRAGRQASCAAANPNVAAVGRIAFVGSDALCVADLRGRSVRMVYGSPTDADETLSSVRWSPDGTTVAVIREERPPRGAITRRIAIVHVDGSAPTAIPTPDEVGAVGSLDWAPDGARLVVAADRPGCSSCARLLIVTIGQDSWTEVRSAPGVSDIHYPAWSPTRDRILINAAINENDATYGKASLWIIDLDGRVVATIADDADHLAPASWSRDGTRIAFGRRVEPGVDVFLSGADGTRVSRLTTASAAAGNDASTTRPVWSPDGATLAVSVYKSNELPHAISIIPAAGGPSTLLIEGAGDFDWSP